MAKLKLSPCPSAALVRFRGADAEFYNWHRGRPSSKALLNRLSAASKAGRGGIRAGRSAGTVLISPIITLSALRLLLLGELVRRAAGSTADDRRTAVGPDRAEPQNAAHGP